MRYIYQQQLSISELRENTSYNFINPLLECNVNYDFYNFSGIKKKLSLYIEEELKKEEIHTISYYFRSLKNGEYFGYNENEEFVPASLLKLPIAISLLRYMPLEKLDTYSLGSKDTRFNTGTTRNFGNDSLQEGEAYSLTTLLTQMLTNSDNTAAILISEYLGGEKLNQVYKDFGIEGIDLREDRTITISAKKYSSFFRVLYNASYISRSSSEYILSLLTHSSFTVGIRGLLPSDVVVANKFGERFFKDIGDERQIHDCGIIYEQDNPYFLCVMTKGTDFDMQIQIIQHISKIIFDDIVENK